MNPSDPAESSHTTPHSPLTPSSKTAALRHKAEQYLKIIGRKREIPEIADLASLIEELSIHQIELELQSEELSKAYEDLSKVKELYFEFYRHAPVPILRASTDGKILEGNLAAHDLLQHPLSPQNQNLSASFRLLLAKDSTRRWSNFLHRVTNSDQPQTVELHFHRPPNQNLYFLATGIRDKNSDILVYFQDIAPLRQREEELLLFRKAIEQSSATVIVTDLDGNITYANPAFELTSGYSVEEALGQNPRILKSGFHPQSFYEEMWQKLVAGETWEGEIQNKRKDGTFYWEKATISPIYNRENQKVGYLAIKHDITERKRFEEFLREMNSQLAEANRQAQEMAMKANEANRAKSEFLANMSHEIRTPMNGILGMLSLLLESGLNDEQLRYARLIRSSAESLLNILNDILDFSKIEARKIELEQVEFDIEDFLHDFALTSAIRARQKQLEFTLLYSPYIPRYLVGDPGRLRQVLNNLISNAVKFTNHGSISVRVSVFHKSSKEALLEFAVADTGIGIPYEKQEEIFEKFVQADSTITRQYGGTGLGLAICKELVHKMGGAIRLRSQPGSGSEFSFTAKFALGHESPPYHPIPDLAEKYFLIFESHLDSSQILEDSLLALGAQRAHIEYPDNLDAALLWLHNPLPKGAIFLSYSFSTNPETAPLLIEAHAKNVPAYIMAYPDQDLAPLRSKLPFQPLLIEKPILLRNLRSLLAEPQLSPASATESPDSSNLLDQQLAQTKARILLAEDNFTNQQVALTMLQKIGLQADAVANGKEVIAALQTLHYDLILMDIQMPLMDGIEATRQIRSTHEPWAHIPIIALTAHVTEDFRNKCLQAGMDDFLAKPFSLKQVRSILKKWLLEQAPAHLQKLPPPTQGITIEPIWNRDAFYDRIENDEEMAKAVISAFLSEAPEQIQNIRNLHSEHNYHELSRHLHSLKGAAANVGADRFSALCARLVEAAKRQRDNELRVAPDVLTRMLEDFRNALPGNFKN